MQAVAATTRERIRIVLVDDHTIVRRGLKSLLVLEADIEVVGEAHDPTEALSIIDKVRPDIVLLDLKLGGPGSNEGLEVCKTVVSSYPESRVIILTAFLSRQLLLEAVKSGASGYVQKEVDTVDLLKIVRAVSNGEAGFDNQAMRMLMGSVSGSAGPFDTPFSDRELEIIRLLAQGLTNAEIARRSFLSESTIKYHLRNISEKLGVHRRAEIIFSATKLGIL